MSSALADPARVLRAAALAVGVVWLPIILLYGPVVHDLTYDDAWYYFQIGRNIADGAGSTFDGTHVTNGYHPLWMLVTAAVYVVGFDDLAAVRALLVIQLVLWVGTLLLLAQVLGRAVDHWPLLRSRAGGRAESARGNLLLAVVLFAMGANPYILKLFVSGMETGVAAFLGVALLAVSVRTDGDPLRRPVLVTALAALLFLARTDAAFLVASLFAWSAILRRGVDRTLMLAAGAVAAVVAAYLTSNVALVGHAMQVSGVTKRIDPDGQGVVTVVLLLVCAAVVLLAGARSRSRGIPGTSRFPRVLSWSTTTAWWPAGSLALLAYEWGFTTEIYFWHYAPPILWVLATIPHAVADIYEGATIERDDDHPAVTSRSWMVAGILALPFVAGGVWQVTAFTHPELRSMQLGDRAAGEWVAANLPDQAVVGSFDAGVFGYFAERPVVNLDGLVNSYDWYDARQEGVDATSAFLVDAGLTHVANHGDAVEGDEPSLRTAIDDLLGDDAGTRMELVHREDYVYRGTAGGRTGRRPYGTFVWELAGAGP
jgi:hypothetical protein